MKPIIKVTTTVHGKSDICKCNPRCEKFVRFMLRDDHTVMCENDAEKHAYEILEELGKVTVKRGPRGNYGWTTQQETFIKDWSQKGFKLGDYKIIAQMLGKEYQAVKRKIYLMRKQGELK